MSATDLDSGDNAKVIMDTIIWSTTTKIILLHKLRLYKDNFSLLWYQWLTLWMNETIFGTSSEVFGNPRFSSEIFCNIRTFSKAETFVWPSDNVWRVCRNLRKMDGNLRKIAIDVVFSMFFFVFNFISHSAAWDFKLHWAIEDKFHLYGCSCITLYVTIVTQYSKILSYFIV